MAVPFCGAPNVQTPSPGQQLEIAETRGHETIFAVVPNSRGGRRGAAARHVRHPRAGVSQSLPRTWSDCPRCYDS